jgi:ABC-type multidrug transport system ATPase subunit
LPASPLAPPSFDFDRVVVSEVSRHFGRRKALAKLTTVFEAGHLVGLLGPNGAGKSTLLSILATLAVPTSGEVRYGTATARQAGAEIRARLGSLGHDLYLYPELTARENLEFFAGMYRITDPVEHVTAALARAGLSERADDLVSGFSRGMRPRLALERALLHGPRLVLLDEPFTGLDDASTHALVRRLAALRADGVIVLLTTHDLDVVDGVIDRAIVLRDGRLAAETATCTGLREWYRATLAGGAAS